MSYIIINLLDHVINLIKIINKKIEVNNYISCNTWYSKDAYCTKRRRSLSYAEEYPDLNERFLSELNGCELKDLNGSNQKDKFYWHCNLCGENFLSSLEMMIKSRNSAYQGCSYCAGKITTRENSFASKHPEVMDEYSPENSIDPYTVTEKSQIYVKWICRKKQGAYMGSSI